MRKLSYDDLVMYSNLPPAVKAGWDKAAAEDMVKVPCQEIKITYVPWSIEIKELAKDVGRIALAIATVNLLGGIGWFDM